MHTICYVTDSYQFNFYIEPLFQLSEYIVIMSHNAYCVWTMHFYNAIIPCNNAGKIGGNPRKDLSLVDRGIATVAAK